MDAATPLDIATLFDTHESERFDLHTRRLNEQMVRVLRTIGYDVGFCKGRGQYLYDRKGERYLDLLSGYGVFAIGRNHPAVRATLKNVLDADLPNLVQMDVSTLAGLSGRAAARAGAASRQSVLREFGRGIGRGCDQVRSLCNRPRRHRLLQPRVPWLDLRGVVAQRR